MDESTVISQANGLLNELLASRDDKYNFGTIVNSVYDTAWVSMVSKKGQSSTQEWAFPECFQFLCQEQAEDGGWGNPISLVERLTCTLVSLLAIKKHLRPLDLSQEARADLQHRADRAAEFIRLNLPIWDLDSLDTALPMAMELWFPVVVERLEEEDMFFDIPGKDRLVKMRNEKLSRFPVDTLYQEYGLVQPSPLFTLEGLLGKVDFGRLRHQKVLGSMFTSPASTAAYLMECPDWDLEAEQYLRHVVEQSIVKSKRSVPTIFPTSTFDIDWVFCLFLDGGLGLEKLDPEAVSPLANMILKCLDEQGGIIGAEKILCPEPDSTAMALKVLNAIGVRRSVQPMIDWFEGPNNYFTYKGERDPSISTNAHVLQALILYSTDGEYTTSIEKCTRYLCRAWWGSQNFVRDKWNYSDYYPTLAIIQAFVEFLAALSEGRVKSLPDSLLKAQIPLVLIQALVRTLVSQNSDGSWGSGSLRENTAYAIMILKHTWCMPLEYSNLKQICDQAIHKGQAFILANMDTPFNDYNWNGKCAYGLLSISRAAALGALLDTRPTVEYSEEVRSLYDLSGDQMARNSEFFRQQPSFADTPNWVIEAAAIEGQFLSRNIPHIECLGEEASEGRTASLAAICCCSNYQKRMFLSNRTMVSVLESTVLTAARIHQSINTDIEDRSHGTLQLVESLLCGLSEVAAGISY